MYEIEGVFMVTRSDGYGRGMGCHEVRVLIWNNKASSLRGCGDVILILLVGLVFGTDALTLSTGVFEIVDGIVTEVIGSMVFLAGLLGEPSPPTIAVFVLRFDEATAGPLLMFSSGSGLCGRLEP
jgi:hypothetical protein